MSVIIVETNDYEKFMPISMTRFLWEISAGIYSSYERFGKLFQEISVLSPRFNKLPYSALKKEYVDVSADFKTNHYSTIVNAQYIPEINWTLHMGQVGITRDGDFVYMRCENIVQEDIDNVMNNNLDALTKNCKVDEVDSGLFLKDMTDIIKLNAKILLNDVEIKRNEAGLISHEPGVFIDRNAKIQQYVTLNAEEGPIVIEHGATVRSFSIIDGPAYIGVDSLIDSAKVRSGTTIKNTCRIGGEVEESVIESFTNKHHEGFVGHSYLGSWVNIGAIATTSDLKNNYGEVRLTVADKTVGTGTNKFGSVICDYSKIGIGMMLNTGTVVGPGSNLFQEGSALPKYIKPFSWGAKKRYQIGRFIEDLETIMERRGETLSADRKTFLRKLYTQK